MHISLLNYPKQDTSSVRSQNPGPLPIDKVGANPLEVSNSSDDDTKALIIQLQKMLFELGYLLSPGSRFNDGVDGKFDLRIKAAVRKFQQDHADWEGKQLQVDGQVGERTGDALNREMVGIWYPNYLSVDKDGNSVPAKRPLATHDFDNELSIPPQSFRIELHAGGAPMTADRTVFYLPNDPGSAGASPPTPPPRFFRKEAYLLSLHSSDLVATLTIRNAPWPPLPAGAPAFPDGTDSYFHPPPDDFDVAGRYPYSGEEPSGSGDFDFQRGQMQVCINRTIRAWRLLGFHLASWNSGNPIHVTLQDPDAALDNGQPSLNAFYMQDTNFAPPARLAMGYNIKNGAITRPYLADSADVASHETGHAVLDSVAPSLLTSPLRTTTAFHEAFGDISAMLTMLTDADVRNELLSENNGDLSKSNIVSRIAEEIGQLSNGNALREAASGDSPSGNLPAGFKYVNPDTIPLLPEDELTTNPLVKNDSRSDLVEDVQKMLLALGSNLGNTGPDKNGIDGSFGDLTDQAVRQFQGDQQLTVDGKVGKDTSHSLNRKAGFEVHEFSKIFTKAFYDSLVNAYKRLLPDDSNDDDKDSTLRQAAGCIGTIFARAIIRTPFSTAGYYRVIAQNMFAVDKQMFAQEFRADMIGTGDENGFVGRDIIKQSEVNQVSPG